MENKFIAEIRKLLNELDPRSFTQTVMAKYKDIYQDVLNNTSFLDPKCGLKLRLVYYMNNIFEFPKCRKCGKICDRILKRDNMAEVIDDPYPVYYCSQKCLISSEEVRSKINTTLHEHFGEEGFKNPEIRRKCVETFRQKYGVDNVAQLQETKDKVAKTMIEHYGKPYMSQVEEIKLKAKQTTLEKYGVDNVSKSDVIKEKISNILISKIGVSNRFLLGKKELQGKSLDVRNSNFYNRLTSGELGIVMLNTYDEFIDKKKNKDYKFKWKCCTCDTEFEGKLDFNYPQYTRCKKCNPLHAGTSKMQKEIEEFIKSVVSENVEVLTDTNEVIGPKELDIYIPQFKLAIEFDGLYYHSQQELEKRQPNVKALRYHWQKTEDCESKGIHLIHIFEDEWLFKKDIVKSRLRGFLNSYDKRVYARKCTIQLLDPKVSREFVAQNHLQGAVNAKVNLGLFYENELVSVMTFGNFRKSMGRTVEPNCYELLRFCSKLNYRVIGGAGKLFKRFLQQYKPYKVITYADRRWSMGVLYQKLGFQNMKKTSPNYWYVIDGHREYRFKYRKNDLHNLLKKFDPNRTEYENMLDNGIDRVFDCGNYSFDMVFPENEVKESKQEDDKDLLF